MAVQCPFLIPVSMFYTYRNINLAKYEACTNLAESLYLEIYSMRQTAPNRLLDQNASLEGQSLKRIPGRRLSRIISQVFGKLCCCCSLHSPTINQLMAAVSHQTGPLHSKEAHRPTCPFSQAQILIGEKKSNLPCSGSLLCSLLKTNIGKRDKGNLFWAAAYN